MISNRRKTESDGGGNKNEPLLLGAAVGIEILTILAARLLFNLDIVTSGVVGLTAGGGSRITVSVLRGFGKFVEVAADALGHPG